MCGDGEVSIDDVCDVVGGVSEGGGNVGAGTSTATDDELAVRAATSSMR